MKSVTKATSKVTRLTEMTSATPGKPGIKTDQTQKKKLDLPLPLPALIALGVLVAGVMIFAIVHQMNRKPTVVQTKIVTPIASTTATTEFTTVGTQPTTVVSITNPSPDYFMNKPDPIGALAEQSTDQAIKGSPTYQPNVGLRTPNGTIIAEASPEMNTIRQAVQSGVVQTLNGAITSQSNGQGGQTLTYISPTGQSMPLATEPAQSQVQQLAFATARDQLQSQLLIASTAQQAGTPVPVQPVQPVQAQAAPSLNNEEKQALMDIIAMQKQQNLQLRMQNREIKDKMATQDRQVTQVFQRLEDSPNASEKLRATMLPKSAGYKYIASINGRYWVQDKTGHITTLTSGEILPGTDLRIVDAQADTGIILVTRK